MIITVSKPIEEILEFIPEKKLFLVGCSICADTCETGGKEQVEAMKETLSENGREVTGTLMIEAICHELLTRKELKSKKEEVKAADAILVMSCGAAVQSVSNLIKKPVYPACDTSFLGNIKRHGHFVEHCSLCGECIVQFTGGICPITNCPKGLLNGPCGGMNDGKCEVDSEKDCAWVLIYNRLKEQGKLELMKSIKTPKNRDKKLKPGKIIIERRKKGAAK